MRQGIVVAVGTLFLAGCGALFNSGPANVMFTSSPNESEVWINGNRMGTTPIALQLKKNQDHTVVFKRQGFGEQTVHLNKKISAGYVILDVLGGFLPVVVDAATGSWYTLPTNAVNVTLQASTAQNSGPVREGQLSAAELAEVKNGAPVSSVLTMAEVLAQ